jgi:predicted nuclease with TOPRIM domain
VRTKKSKESLANLREESNKAIEDMKHEYSKLTVENDNLMDTNEILNDEIYNLKEKIEFLNEDIVMMNIDMSEIALGGMCFSPESTVAEEKTDNDEEESVRIKIEPSP